MIKLPNPTPKHSLTAQPAYVQHICIFHNSTLVTSRRMCSTKIYHSRECKHKWMVVNRPCGPGMGFNNCVTFDRNFLRYGSPTIAASIRDCPWHSLGGNYDLNRVRMIEKMNHGVYVGGWPGTLSSGYKLACCSVM